MKTAVIRPLCFGLLAATLVLPVHAGTNAAAVAAAREKAREERAAQRQAPEERETRRGDGEGRRSGGGGGGEARRQRDERNVPPPPVQAPPAAARGDERRRDDDRGRQDRGWRQDDRGYRDERGARDDRGFRYVAPPRYNHRPAPPPPPRVVYRLPPGYRSYDWDGGRWYHHRGSWYRPYGSSYMTVGAPYGLFVPFLPPFHTTVWVRGTRYYVVDDIYYVDEPVRRVYVVARSPYGEDAQAGTEWPDDEPDPVLYVYPMRGQSAEQQADDRYACHRWAVGQTRYDPTEGRYAPAERAEYDRAQGACLEARGYSVK